MPRRAGGRLSGLTQVRPAILVIDDNERTRKSFSVVLWAAGFEVQNAEDGLDALQNIRNRVPDLIILDLDMPRFNVVAFHRQLVTNHATRTVPVIAMTAIDTLSPVPVADQLKKPIAGELLVTAVKRALSAARSDSTSAT